MIWPGQAMRALAFPQAERTIGDGMIFLTELCRARGPRRAKIWVSKVELLWLGPVLFLKK